MNFGQALIQILRNPDKQLSTTVWGDWFSYEDFHREYLSPETGSKRVMWGHFNDYTFEVRRNPLSKKEMTVSQIEEKAQDFDGMKAVIVRTYSAGVFYGYLKSLEGKTAILVHARRMWQWYGASLSECAQSGTPNKSKCKFPELVSEITLTEAIEVLNLSSKAKSSLDEVPVWKA